jgi:DNA-binding MarR family transcriptional regulator
MDLDGIAAQIGVPRARVDEEVERLERQGHLRRQGDRLIVVERAEGF